MAMTDKELVAKIDDHNRAAKIVAETFDNAPDSLYKRIAEDGVRLSRKYLTEAIEIQSQLNNPD